MCFAAELALSVEHSFILELLFTRKHRYAFNLVYCYLQMHRLNPEQRALLLANFCVASERGFMGADEAEELLHLEANKLEKGRRDVHSARFSDLMFVIDNAKELRAQYCPPATGRKSDLQAPARIALAKRLRALDIFKPGAREVVNFSTGRPQTPEWVKLHGFFGAAAYGDDGATWKAATGTTRSGFGRLEAIFSSMVGVFRNHGRGTK